MSCAGCEQLPVLPDGAGCLYLGLPLAHSRQKLLASVAAAGWSHRLNDLGLVELPIKGGALPGVLERLGDWLSTTEVAATKSLFVPEGEDIGLGLVSAVEPLSKWIGRVRGRWLGEILEAGRLTTHFQPIVHVNEPGTPYAYECLLRGLDDRGDSIAPGPLFDAARAADMLFHLDRAARLKAIEESWRLGSTRRSSSTSRPHPSMIRPFACARPSRPRARRDGIPAFSCSR